MPEGFCNFKPGDEFSIRFKVEGVEFDKNWACMARPIYAIGEDRYPTQVYLNPKLVDCAFDVTLSVNDLEVGYEYRDDDRNYHEVLYKDDYAVFIKCTEPGGSVDYYHDNVKEFLNRIQHNRWVKG